jgi:hypothetical protein
MTLNTGTVTNVFGRDFKLAFTRSLFGTPEYRLTGSLSDGSPLDAIVLLSSNAQLRFVPEPATCVLMLCAVGLLAALRPFRRKPSS